MNGMSGMRRGVAVLALGSCLVGLAPGAAQAVGNGAVTVTAETNGATSASPRADVVFTLGRVKGVDPTTAAGWKSFTEMQQDMYSASPAVTDVVTLGATDAEGQASISGLDEGVYVLHEQGVKDAAGVVTPDPEPYADSLLAIPMKDDQGNPVSTLDVMPKQTPSTPELHQTPQEPSTPGTTGTPGTRTGTRTPSTGGLVPSPGGLITITVPGTQVRTMVTQREFSQRVTTRINSGGGADFVAADQWATIAGGLVLVAGTCLATRKRRPEEA